MKITTVFLLLALACLSEAHGYSCSYQACFNDPAFVTVFGIVFVGCLIIGCVLCKKCMDRREQRENLKTHMEIRRRQFATLQGLDLYQSHKMQMYKTIHV